MLRPLIFRNFISKIFRKTKWAAPLIRPKLRFVHLPPKGKAIIIAIINRHPRARFKSELKTTTPGARQKQITKTLIPGALQKRAKKQQRQARVRNEQDAKCEHFRAGTYK